MRGATFEPIEDGMTFVHEERPEAFIALPRPFLQRAFEAPSVTDRGVVRRGGSSGDLRRKLVDEPFRRYRAHHDSFVPADV